MALRPNTGLCAFWLRIQRHNPNTSMQCTKFSCFCNSTFVCKRPYFNFRKTTSRYRENTVFCTQRYFSRVTSTGWTTNQRKFEAREPLHLLCWASFILTNSKHAVHASASVFLGEVRHTPQPCVWHLCAQYDWFLFRLRIGRKNGAEIRWKNRYKKSQFSERHIAVDFTVNGDLVLCFYLDSVCHSPNNNGNDLWVLLNINSILVYGINSRRKGWFVQCLSRFGRGFRMLHRFLHGRKLRFSNLIYHSQHWILLKLHSLQNLCKVKKSMFLIIYLP